MSFPKQKKPRSWRVLQDWIRHYADQGELPQSRVRRAVSFMLVALPLDRSLDEALAEDIDDFSYSRDEPVRIRGTNTFRVNIAIDYKGKRWGKVQLEVAPIEVEAALGLRWPGERASA